ncbi:hypothetical protein [Ferviditalea candida]
MMETAKRYKMADVVDYLHVGYRTVSPGSAKKPSSCG